MKTRVRVSIDDVAEGAELAADLQDAKGRILIKQGTALSAESISALRRRNIDAVEVFADQALDAEEIAARRAEIAARVEARFAAHGDNALMQRFKTEVIAYRCEVLR